MRHVQHGVGAAEDVVAQLHITLEEDALPGDEHVVKDDDGIHLLEAGAERMIEVRAADVKALPTDEPQARRVARDREGVRIRRGIAALLQHGRGEDHDLLGERCGRGQHARAANKQPVVRLRDDACREIRIGLP